VQETRQPTGRDDARATDWWRDAVIYQVYVRSFADGNGDGTGDLAGVRARLGYLRDLRVDAIWFSPWYPSPMADSGYDIADYRSIEPAFGTLAEAELLITEALELGIRTIIDVVPNHVSDQHPWFQAALTEGPGTPARELFWFRPGRGRASEEPPTDWVGEFGGQTWTRSKNPDGQPGEWFLHLFTAQQPDLNWDHPEVRREHEDVLRFWFDRGVAGIRIDSAALLVKDATLPEAATDREGGQHPFTDRDELHDIYRGWRQVADSYPGGRVLVGELWLPDPVRFAQYLRPDELHTAFNFDFMTSPWDARRLRQSINSTLAAHAPVGAPATWVLSNHDVTRPVTRYGRLDTSFAFETKRADTPTDIALGTRRARAAALLAMALPGALYVYQGEELGLPEVEDIPVERRNDPMYFRSGGIDPGREGCRVPLPWAGDAPPYAFSPGDADGIPWLPQPDSWQHLTVEAQLRDPDSMLQLYRAGLRVRAEQRFSDGANGALAWLEARHDVHAFKRQGPAFASLTNFGQEPADLPDHEAVLLSSSELEGGQLPSDSTAWLRLPTR
jgi:alpha-glucosidase